MSLPTTRILPPVPDFENVEDAHKYLHDLKFELQDMYESITQNVNGFYRNSESVDGNEWIPTIEPTGNPGNITYLQQGGWVLRQGLITDCWFHLSWSSIGSATGELRIGLPYRVTKNNLVTINPFMGVMSCGDLTLQSAAHTFVFCEAFPDSYVLSMASGGNGVPANRIILRPPTSTNSFIAGHIRYIGVEDE